MRCPNCQCDSVVYGTAQVGAVRQRYRLCRDCGHRWKSYEDGAEAVRSTPRNSANQNQLSIFDILDGDWIDE